MSNNQQRLIDALQVIALRAQSIEVSARVQQQDAAALLDATKRAIAEVQGGAR